MTSTGPDSSGPAAEEGRQDGTGGLAGSLAGLLEGYARIMSQIAGGGPGAADGARIGSTAALIEAGSIASGSALRYSQRLTELFARHQSALIEAIPAHLSGQDLPPDRARAEVESLRRFLREVGETAMLEARRLDHELAQLGEAVAQGVADPVSAEDFQRRAEAKL
ncbi:hypothetical protein ILP92_16235 [Maribius pontilimi]|uniref:Uncharacterized protein n=1 Tax=Palleronia pontilimi TaxID=1964209 RepID=A0A934MII9_9RHOB|nr:hypothetical protein [Palleronia pontilimi]MBJ3764299.1 hypothetical protein [Palleronia pontilimi]